MPTAMTAPTIGPGAGFAGPALVTALRVPKDTNEKSPGKRRRRWNGRHQVLWNNDVAAQNMRSYFDRMVEQEDIPVVPRRQLRPTWIRDIPEKVPEDLAYSIFDAPSATFKEQDQWAALPMPKREEPSIESKKPTSTADARRNSTGGGDSPSQSQSQPPKRPSISAAQAGLVPLDTPAVPVKKRRPRTPRRGDDLKKQREVEKSWDRSHSVVFSRFNEKYQGNVRSYFDRWKDDEGRDGVFNAKDVTWRLAVERKPLIKRSASEPAADYSGGWVSNF